MRLVSVVSALLAAIALPGRAAAPPTNSEEPLPDSARLRIGTARFRVDGYTRTAALSADGRFVAVTGGESVLILDSATGREVRRVPMGREYPEAIKFSADGKRLVTCDFRRVAVCDAVKGQVLATFAVSAHEPRLSLSRDGKRIAIGSGVRGETGAVVWEVGEKKPKTFAVKSEREVGVALSADGAFLATWGDNQREGNLGSEVQLWDVAKAAKKAALSLEDQCITATFSPDGKRVAVVDGGGTLGVWDVAKGECLVRFAARGREHLLEFSADGKVLASASAGGVQLWDLVTSRRARQGEAPAETRVTSIAFGPDNRAIAAGLCGESVRVWEVSSGRVRGHVLGHDSMVTAVAFSSDGKALVTGGADGLRSWNPETGALLRRVSARRERSQRGDGLRYRLSPDGRFAVWGERYSPGYLAALDARTGEEVASLGYHAERDDGAATAFSADGAFASLRFDRDRMRHRAVARVWHLDTGRQGTRITLDLPYTDRPRIAVSPGAKMMAVASGNHRGRPVRLIVWDLASGKAVLAKDIGTEDVSSLSFSADGSLLAVCAASLSIWEVQSGTELIIPSEKLDRFSAIAFSPDGRTLAACRREVRSGENEVWLCELGSGKVRDRLSGHRGGALALAFSPDGRTLATGGSDTTVLLWDVTGRSASSVRKRGKPTARELAELWDDLEHNDSTRAYRAMGRLVAYPAEAVGLLGKHLHPAKGKPLADKEVKRLIEELADDSFEVRERATSALKQAGSAVQPALVAARKSGTDLEQRRRLVELLQGMGSVLLPPEILRTARAVEVLERLRTEKARQLLASLAKGNSGARLTADANAALKRLATEK